MEVLAQYSSEASEGAGALVLLIFVGLWILIGYASAKVMANKGRSAGAGWALGLLLGGLGLLIAALMPKRNEGGYVGPLGEQQIPKRTDV